MKPNLRSMNDLLESKYEVLKELLDEYLVCEDESRLSELRDMIDKLDYSIELDEEVVKYGRYINNINND